MKLNLEKKKEKKKSKRCANRLAHSFTLVWLVRCWTDPQLTRDTNDDTAFKHSDTQPTNTATPCFNQSHTAGAGQELRGSGNIIICSWLYLRTYGAMCLELWNWLFSFNLSLSLSLSLSLLDVIYLITGSSRLDDHRGWLEIKFVCWPSVGVRSTPRVTAVARKRSRSFCQKCRWQVTPKYAYTLTQRSRRGLTMPLSRHSVGNLSGTEPTRNSSGNTRSQSSQLAKPLWTDPGLKSGISVRELISTWKKKKSTAGKWMVEHSLQIFANEEKATTTKYQESIKNPSVSLPILSLSHPVPHPCLLPTASPPS